MSHHHLKDGIVGKTREVYVPQEAHAQVCPREASAQGVVYPSSSCHKLGWGSEKRAKLNSLCLRKKKFNTWPEGTGGRTERKEDYL